MSYGSWSGFGGGLGATPFIPTSKLATAIKSPSGAAGAAAAAAVLRGTRVATGPVACPPGVRMLSEAEAAFMSLVGGRAMKATRTASFISTEGNTTVGPGTELVTANKAKAYARYGTAIPADPGRSAGESEAARRGMSIAASPYRLVMTLSGDPRRPETNHLVLGWVHGSEVSLLSGSQLVTRIGRVQVAFERAVAGNPALRDACMGIAPPPPPGPSILDKVIDKLSPTLAKKPPKKFAVVTKTSVDDPNTGADADVDLDLSNRRIGEEGPIEATPPEEPTSDIPWGTILGGAAALGLIVYLARKKKPNRPRRRRGSRRSRR
jgi:hypothetical protein